MNNSQDSGNLQWSANSARNYVLPSAQPQRIEQVEYFSPNIGDGTDIANLNSSMADAPPTLTQTSQSPLFLSIFQEIERLKANRANGMNEATEINKNTYPILTAVKQFQEQISEDRPIVRPQPANFAQIEIPSTVATMNGPAQVPIQASMVPSWSQRGFQPHMKNDRRQLVKMKGEIRGGSLTNSFQVTERNLPHVIPLVTRPKQPASRHSESVTSSRLIQQRSVEERSMYLNGYKTVESDAPYIGNGSSLRLDPSKHYSSSYIPRVPKMHEDNLSTRPAPQIRSHAPPQQVIRRGKLILPKDSWRRMKCSIEECSRISRSGTLCSFHGRNCKCVFGDCDRISRVYRMCFRHCPEEKLAKIKNMGEDVIEKPTTGLSKVPQFAPIAAVGGRKKETSVIAVIAPIRFTELRKKLVEDSDVEFLNESFQVWDKHTKNIRRAQEAWPKMGLLKSEIFSLTVAYKRIISKGLQRAIFRLASTAQGPQNLLQTTLRITQPPPITPDTPPSTAPAPEATECSDDAIKAEDERDLQCLGFEWKKITLPIKHPRKTEKRVFVSPEGDHYSTLEDILFEYTPKTLAMKHIMPIQDLYYVFQDLFTTNERKDWASTISNRDASRPFILRLSGYKNIRKTIGLGGCRIKLNQTDYMISTLPMVIKYDYDQGCACFFMDAKRVNIAQLPRELIGVLGSQSGLPSVANVKKDPCDQAREATDKAAPGGKGKEAKPPRKRRSKQTQFADEYKKVFVKTKRRRSLEE